MGVKQTHTYAELEVSAEAYAEIATKLVEAGYSHVFELSGNGITNRGAIDMHGLALTTKRTDVDAVALDATNEVLKAYADYSQIHQYERMKAHIQVAITEAIRKCLTK